ncbi:MAG: type II toxin-antitoxin system prevent-host-death family antitoxin [Nitrospirae bacterium]|nr:type II toxin-antitoxin system prevent-host-death family antitoxin [Nitrospirota bacterium]
MKFITVRDFRIRPGSVWESLEKSKEVVITSNGKPIALLTGVSDVNFDETLRAIRRARAELVVSKMRETSLKKGLSKLTAKNIEAEIISVRKARKQC